MSRFDFQASPVSNPIEVSAKARALVSEIASGIRFENGMNVATTLAASVVTHSLFTVIKLLPMTEEEARAACDAALGGLIAQGFIDDPRQDGKA